MNFELELHNLIKQIPAGKFTTYKELSVAMGDLRARNAIRKTILQNSNLSKFTNCILSIEECSENKLFREFTTDYPLRRLREEQLKLRDKISLKDEFKSLRTVAGIDVAYLNTNKAIGACAIFDYIKRKLIRTETAELAIEFPYIPTYLGFRELPVIQALVERLDSKPTVLMIDGNGVLHPYGFGIASHIGVILDLATIGVAKSLLCGTLERKLKLKRDCTKIFHRGRLVGFAFKPSSHSKQPIYISPGNKISFETSLAIVQKFCKSRIPEPIKEAHKISNQMKRNS